MVDWHPFTRRPELDVGTPRGTLPKTSSRWDSGRGNNPHKNRMRVATADDGRSSLTGNATPAARLTGQNVRRLSQLKLENVVQFMLRPSDGVHRVGTPGAGPRRVAEARDHAPLRHWPVLRAATTGRHQGDAGGQAPGGGAARSRNRRIAGDLRRQQQQLRREGSTPAPLHTQTPTARWNSSGLGSCMGVK